jgi:hypothetical protein
MKKIIFLFFLLELTCIEMHAQNKIDKLDLTYGEEITEEKGKIIKIIGEANNKIYALGLKGKKEYFLKIFSSKEMKLLSNKPIVLPELENKDISFEEITILNDRLYIIGSVYQRKEKIFKLVGIEFSEDGVLNTKMITLFESQVAKSSDRGGFYFKQSPDENKLLVMHTALFEKEDAMKYEIKLFDDQLKADFSTEDKVSYDDSKKDYQFTISDFDVNFKNDVFLIVNEGYRDSKKKEKIEKFEVHVFKNQNNYKKEVVNIDIKGKEIINCKMMSTNKNTLQIVGFYSSVRENGKANKELKGVYNATINLTNNVNENLKFNEFDYETKVKLLGERRAKKGKDVKPLYEIQSIIEKNDGGLIVISEYRLIIVGQTQGFGPLGFTPITYVANEMIVTSLKPDGTLEWSNVVAKDQLASVTVLSLGLGAFGGNGSFTVSAGVSIPLTVMGKGPEYLSAIPIYKEGQLNILFNDNKKNKGITDIEQIKSLGNYNNAVLTLFTFDDKGQITRKDPEEILSNQLVMRPGIFYRKNQKEYLIYASRKSEDKLGRMILN